MKKLSKLSLMGLLCLVSPSVFSQNINDAARYFDNKPISNGVNFNTSGAFGLHSVDFGSVVFNPAMSALFNHNKIDFGLDGVYNRADASYLNNSVNSSESTFQLTSLGGVFKIPTYQGSLAVSVGYVKKADFNNQFTAFGFNSVNSVSDAYAQSNDANLRLIAYNGYAVDSVGNELQSVYRFPGFEGIDQYIEQQESGQMGEFIINASTEFQKDMFVGISIGIPISTYSFGRIYLEEDLMNNYDTSPSDVQSMLVTEKIDAQGAGIYAKLGLVFKPADHVRVGFSYQSPYTMQLQETYSNTVSTSYDDGFGPSDSYPYRLNGEFNYSISTPSIIQAGFAIENWAGFDFGITAEYKNFSSLAFETDAEFKVFEIEQNKNIKLAFKDVLNLNIGAGYQFETVSFQAGVAYLPTYLSQNGTDRLIFSSGINAKISNQLNVFAGLRYQQITEDRALYSTTDYGVNPLLNTNGSWLTTQIGLVYTF